MHHYEDKTPRLYTDIELIQRKRLLETPAEYIDEIGVDNLARAMKAKLAEKRCEGKGGWYNPKECKVEFLVQLLDEHIKKGDLIDIANFCMMLFNRAGGQEAIQKANQRLKEV